MHSANIEPKALDGLLIGRAIRQFAFDDPAVQLSGIRCAIARSRVRLLRAYLKMGSFFGRSMRALTTWHAYSIRRHGSSATRSTRWGIRRKR